MIDFDKLEEIALDATPGPWRSRYDGYGDGWIETEDEPVVNRMQRAGELIALFEAITSPEDRAFVATFDPPTVLALIALARKACQ